MAVHDGAHHALVPRYGGVLAALRAIAAREGVAALYGGIAPALVGGALSWGLYFGAYGEAKRRVAAARDCHPAALGAADHVACAAASGALVSLATNPLWVVKTRMALGAKALSTAAADGAAAHPPALGLRALAAELRAVAAKEGVAGLYSGLAPSLALVSHGAVQFAAYEHLKRAAQRLSAAAEAGGDAGGGGAGGGGAQGGGAQGGGAQGGGEDVARLSPASYAALGAASKLCAMGVTYPLGTLRSRLQQQALGGRERAKYERTALQAARRILAVEGPGGFYKGCTAAAMRVVPAAATTFVVYELALDALAERER